MPDVAKLVGDLTRLSVEIDSGKAQVAKLKKKSGPKEKVREAVASVAESQAFYDAIVAELPPEVAAEAVKHIAKLRKAQDALDAVNADLAGSFPSEPDITVAPASGAAHDATVKVN